MSSPVTAYSSFSSTGANLQLIIRFLEFREAVVDFSRLDRKHYAEFNKKEGYWYITATKIPASRLNQLFESIDRFPKLQSLTLTGKEYQPFMPLSHGVTQISRLTLQGGGNALPAQPIISLLEALPSLIGLSLFNISRVQGQEQFRPVAEEMLTDRALVNLHLLTELDLSGSLIHHRGILSLLSSSVNFRSINLEGYCSYARSSEDLAVPIMRQFTKSLKLAHLNLGVLYTKNNNYRILAECHSLESFKVGPHLPTIPTEDFLAIVRANPKLVDLDLAPYCGESDVNELLQEIEAMVPNLRKIHLGTSYRSKITEAGFLSLIQKCKYLRSLHFFSIKVPPEALLELRHCRNLQELNLTGSLLSDAMIEVLASLQALTSLALGDCRGFSERSLYLLQGLIHLEILKLSGIDVLTDRVIAAVMQHCPILTTLGIADAPLVTTSSLGVIEAAIRKRSTSLKNLSVGDGVPFDLTGLPRAGYYEITFQMARELVARLKADGFTLNLIDRAGRKIE